MTGGSTSRVDGIVSLMSRTLYWIAGVILAGMVAGNLYEVIARYVFSRPSGFMDEILTYGNMSIIFLVLAYAWRTKGHVVVDIIPMKLRGRAATNLALANLIISLLILGLLAAASLYYEVYLFEKMWRAISTLRTPYWVSNTPICIGIVVLILEVALSLVKGFRNRLSLVEGN
ncbi:TRAP transporter small permease [Chloroflexota bacterium]